MSRCDCGDFDCPSCGVLQGTYYPEAKDPDDQYDLEVEEELNQWWSQQNEDDEAIQEWI